MNREDLNKKVSEIFDKETIDSLKKFSNHIDSQNADIIILIARKAICLFELFNYLGINKPKGEIVSDRILDLDAGYFKGKKVIVVDDTLIIGTTLKEIKEKLTNFNVDFQIFAFCVDRDNWQKDLIIPNYIEKYYSSQELLNFCILAVKAFSIVSMPYLVDFPITNFNSITKTEFENIVKSDKLTPIKLPVNEFECNKLYTFLLKSEIKEMFYNKVGDSFRNIVEIVKVRAFISIVDEQNYRIRLVPIVLLKPIPKKVINDLFFYLISFSESQIFKQLLITTKTRMRFIQYYLSVSLGQIFIENFANEKLQNHFIFKCSEIINIFGKIISVEYEKLLNENTILPFSDVIDFMPYDNYSDKFEDVFENIEVEGFNIVSSFQEIFANLFTKRELPARKELQDGNHNTHLKNRLINGISFEKISKFFCEKLQIGLTEEIREIFSICLDICNDLGVSIPIICNNKEEVCKVCNKNKECNDKGKEECNNNEIIYFRAYRHGELGKRTKGNVFLLNTFLEAFCESNGYDVNKGFDNVLLEKLAVLFYRVGVKNRFLEVTENYSDPTAINIGFYLMGAVLIENKPNEYFPNDYHDWFLMNHCYNLFKKQKVSFDTYKYFFNIKPTREGANTKEGAEFTARILGRAFGNAIRLRKRDIPENTELQGIPLDLDRLTILATCYTSGDIAMALAAELNIYYNWIKILEEQLNRKDFILDSNCFDKWESSTVYQAFNQTYFKFSHSFSDDKNVKRIIDDTTLFLRENSISRDGLDAWNQYATKLNIGQDDLFLINNKINSKIIENIFDIARYMFEIGNILICIRLILEVYQDIKRPTIAINSEFEFEDMRTGGIYRRKIVPKLKKEDNILFGYEIGYLTDAGTAFRGKSIGEIANIFIKGKSYKCKILKISNYNLVFNAQIELQEFNDRLFNIFKSYNFLKGKSIYLPENYDDMSKMMKSLSNCRNPNVLNKELRDIIKTLSKDVLYIEQLLETTKRNYSKSKEDLVSILIPKR